VAEWFGRDWNERMNDYETALDELKALAVELRKCVGVDSVYLEYPCYLHIRFEGANEDYLSLAFADIEEDETPIMKRLWVQSFEGDGAYGGEEAFFDFVEGNPSENAFNFIQCVFGSTMFAKATQTDNN
jgi:hypothetical protein